MKITSMTRQALRLTSDRVLDALKTLETELGVKFSYEGGSYGIKGVIKLGVEVQDTGSGKSSAQLTYETYCGLWGCKPEWFGQTFCDRGIEYRLVGVNPSSPKFSLNIERVRDGMVYKATADMAKRGFAAQGAA